MKTPTAAAVRRIPLHVPSVGRAEADAAADAVLSGRLVGRGPIGAALEDRIAADLKVKHALLTTSGSHALELAAASLKIGRGDEVIMPSFTFSSVANAVMRQGAKPVFAEVKLDDLNLDPEDVARRITKKTKAIVAVHYAGVASDMEALLRLCRKHGLALIEDAAHSVGAKWRGRPLGTIGDAGCYSFHSTKNITCGEGGAFFTNSNSVAERAEWFREKGTNRSAFLRGEVRKYDWVSEGSSFVLSDVLAAVLAVQWGKIAAINAERGRLYALYQDALRDLDARGLLRLPRFAKDCEPSWHLFHILLPTRRERDRVMDAMKADGVGATFHYQPLHASPFGKKVLGWKEPMPLSERAGATLLRLPLYDGLTTEDARYVCGSLRRALTGAR
ncbi:MAG: dTDP-4-amino-4,6-dideoxygalactose transaminase [Elusimicrobiota bacterium]|nr:MAG: dTDP-4-amino-4,6-dideoxygalactose transaminase [Elusimicrobiota bacterium]